MPASEEEIERAYERVAELEREIAYLRREAMATGNERDEARSQLAAQAVAIEQMRQACIEEIGNEHNEVHNEVQCSICMACWPITIPEQHFDDCFLAEPGDARGASIIRAGTALRDAARVIDFLIWSSKRSPIRTSPQAEALIAAIKAWDTALAGEGT